MEMDFPRGGFRMVSWRDLPEPLLPDSAIEVPDELREGILEFGSLSPLVEAGGFVVDGLKRRICLRTATEVKIPLVTTEADPFLARWILGRTRAWNPVEIALTIFRLPAGHHDGFFETVRVKKSPHLYKALEWVRGNPETWQELLQGRVGLGILRELAHLGDRFGEFLLFLMRIDATAAERRVISGLLRNCAGMGTLPVRPPEGSAENVISSLRRASGPRRSALSDRFREFRDRLALPPGTTVEPDPTFERPGVNVGIHLSKGDLGRLRELETELGKLFAEFPEI